MSRKRFAAVIFAVVSLFVSMPQVGAQEATGGSGLIISPTRAEYTINPGKADNIQVTLKNISGSDITAKAVVNDFEADNDSGEPRVLVDAKSDSANSVKNFLVGVTDIPLKKDETKKFDIPIQIPAGTASGAYYGVIRFTAVTAQKQENGAEKQVALNASLGLIVLIQVPGSITEQIQAQKIAVDRNGSNGSVFIAGPQHANISLKNIGNGFSKPYGRVIIKRGNTEVFTYEMNDTDPRSNVLPNSSRTFKQDIKNVNALGRYTATANISYGSGGDIITLKTTFWVFPLWFVITVSVVLLVLVIVGLLLYRRINRKRKRHAK